METLILAVFLLSEIALYVYSAKNKIQKGKWVRNKLFVHGGQFAFFLVALLLPSVNLNIRFKLIFVILIIRTVISGVFYLVKRKNEERKNLVAGFFNLLANVVVIILAIIPAFVFCRLQWTG